MAFTDVIDRKNVESVLVLKLVLRTTSGGVGATLYLGDRYMEATVDGSNRVISGIVKDWDGFGYTVDFDTFESVVSDCSFLFSVQDLIHLFNKNILYMMHYYEVVGADLVVYQLAKWAGSWESRQVWRGVVREPVQVTTDGVRLSAVDLTITQGVTPNTVISLTDFPAAPEASIGRSIPVVYGDHGEHGPSGKEVNAQQFGMNPRHGIPAICVDDSRDSTYKAGVYQAMCHGAKAYDTTTGAALHAPGHRDKTNIPTGYWTITNTPGAPGTGKLEIELDWPMIHNRMPAMPMGIATGNQATNPENAWDRHYWTTVTMTTGSGEELWLAGTIPAVSPSGTLWNMRVDLWVVSCVPDDKINFGLWNPTTSSWVASWAGIGTATETIYGLGALQNNELWDASAYELRAKLLQNATCTIRAIRLLFQYAPSNSPIPYRYRHRPKAVKTFPGGMDHNYDVAAYRRRVLARGTQPSDIQVMAQATGLQDDGSGTYTGTANALIEHGADQMHHLIGEFSDLASADIAGSTDHGSFTQARTDLGTYHKLAPIIREKQSINEMLYRLAFQSRSMPIWNGEGKRGMIVIRPTPSADYRSGSIFKFYADEHFEAKSFQFGRTPIERIANQVYVDFDFDYGAEEFRKTTFVTESDSDNGFGTRDQEGIRELTAANSQPRFGVVQEYRLEAYDVMNQGVAKALRNWIFDWRWRSKLWIQFESFLNASDLAVGKVIQLGDEVINGLEVTAPDDASDTWDDFTWWVTQVERIGGTSTTPRYRVRALEAVPCGWMDNWAATADD